MKLLTKLLIFLSFSLFIFGTLFFFVNYFKISVFEIEGEKNIILNGTSSFIGDNLIFFDTEEAQKQLINENSSLKDIKIDKIYPNKLKIKFKLSEPIALLKVSAGYFALSDEARIIAKRRNLDLNLPLLTYYQQFDFMSFNIGDKIDYQDIRYALKILRITLNLGINPDTIDIKDINMIASKIGEKEILFSSEKDLDQEEKEFETIIRSFKIQGKNFKLLDLRFDKPIVKF